MLHVKVISFKALNISAISELEADYLQRLKRVAKLELSEINSTRFAKLAPAQLLEKEGELVSNELGAGEYMVTLTESGRQLTSAEMASWLAKLQTTGHSKLAFVIGSPHGLSQSLVKKAHYNLSLSPLTFTAQFARLILLEQVYRCFAINNNLPYHKAGV